MSREHLEAEVRRLEEKLEQLEEQERRAAAARRELKRRAPAKYEAAARLLEDGLIELVKYAAGMRGHQAAVTLVRRAVSEMIDAKLEEKI